jgi:hypothetical protein
MQLLPLNTSPDSVYGWWRKCRRRFNKAQKSHFDGMVVYFWWNIWKERSRRTFQHECKTTKEVTHLIKEDVQLFQ